MDRIWVAHATRAGWGVAELKDGHIVRMLLEDLPDKAVAQTVATSYQNGYEHGIQDTLRNVLLRMNAATLNMVR